MSRPFKIRDILADKGTKVIGSLTIEDSDTASVKLTVGIINGLEEGPVLCLTGGMMGTHYPGINACIRIFNEIEPKKLKGTLITTPVMNMPAFQRGMDGSPIDDLSLVASYAYSVFPGDPDGTITRRIAYVVFNEIIKKSQYHLDLRGGDLIENILIFVYSFETGNKSFDDVTKAMIKAMDIDYYVNVPEGRGSLVGEANKAGTHSIVLIGSKGLGTFDEEEVERCMNGLYNMLKHLKMISGKTETSLEPKQLKFDMQMIRAKQGGLLYLKCSCGDLVSKGQNLGCIKDLTGKVLQELLSPIDGVLDFTRPSHIIQPGNLIIGIRQILG